MSIGAVVCATSKASDQPVHTCSLVRAFACHLNIQCVLSNWQNINLKGGCTGLSESTLVKMQHCWKSHVTAHSIIWSTCIINLKSHILLPQLYIEYCIHEVFFLKKTVFYNV